MHELAITESLLEVTLRHAESSGASEVTDLYLVIGRLSSVVDDSVQFYWDIISDGTIAKGARLHFRRVPVEMRCMDCSLTYRPEGEDLACPTCDGVHVQVLQGDEFHLEAIDVEPGQEADAEGDSGGAAPRAEEIRK